MEFPAIWCLSMVVCFFGCEAADNQGKQYASLSFTEQPSDLTFLNTIDASITCKSSGQLSPKITWLTESGSAVTDIPELRTVSNDRLIFHHFRAERYDARIHDTKYRCKVTSLAGEIISRLASVRAELDIRYSPIVHHQPANQNAPAIFKCHLPPYKSFLKVHQWQIISPHNSNNAKILGLNDVSNGFKVLSTGELLILNVAKSHGDYKFACVSINVLSNATMRSSPAMLYINENSPNFGPRSIIKPRPQTVQEGDDLHLYCYASAHPRPLITWEKDSVKLSDSTKVSIDIERLTVVSVSSADWGRYSCVINGKEKYRYDAFVKVKVPLVFIEKPETIHVKDDQTSARFKCKAIGSMPIIYHWFKNGQKLSSETDVTITSGEKGVGSVLEIQDIDIKDEGSYQCFAFNHFESVQYSVQLVVDSVLPNITSISPGRSINEGDALSIVCQYTALPRPKQTWMYENRPVEESSNIVINSNGTFSELRVPKFTMAMSGRYQCLVENRVGLDSKYVNIKIEGKPLITDFESMKEGLVGKPLSLHCNVKGSPKPLVRWMRWGSRVTSSQSMKVLSNGTLLIGSFSANEEGEFECHAQNSFGRTSKKVYVKSIEPPVISPVKVDPAIAGSRVLFTCICNRGSSDDLTITWYKDGILANQIDGIEKQIGNRYTSNIFIEKVNAKHHGRYTCIARNRAGEMSRYQDFVVYEKVLFKDEPKDTSVLYKHATSLACLATGFPAPQIIWMKKSPDDFFEPIQLTNRVQQLNNGTLHITMTTGLDDGEYACKAFFDTKQPVFIPPKMSRTAHVKVKVPARVVHSSPTIARMEKGGDVHLICSIVGTTQLSVKWFMNGAIIDNRNSKYQIETNENIGALHQTSMLNSTLVIKNVLTRDNATYECMGRNLYGSNKKFFHIMVEEKPSKPIIIRQLDSTPDSMLLSWTAGYNGNLDISEYIIQIKRQNDESDLILWTDAQTYSVAVSSVPYRVVNLHPGTQYMVRVKAKNRIGFSDYSHVFLFSTKEKAPSSPPQNVTIVAIAKDKFLLQWKHPSKTSRNGILTRYQISFTPTSSLVVVETKIVNIPSVTEYTLTNLYQYTAYKVQLQAATKAGLGPPSTPVYATTLEGVPSQAPTSVEAHALSAHQIVITWKAIPQNAVNGVLKGYTVQYTDIERSKHYQTSVKRLQASLTNLKAFTRYQIRVSAYTKIGLGVASTEQHIVTYEDRPGKPADFKAIPANPKEIVLTWRPPLEKNGILLNYNIYFKSEHDEYERKSVVQPHLVKYRIQDLVVMRKYTFWMSAVTSKGEGNFTEQRIARTTTHVPARIITPQNFIIHKPIGSDVSLPCTAVGYPKPMITWSNRHPSGNNPVNTRRWMAEDKPMLLYRITKDAEGEYNCTAMNSYGSDWNVVKLKVQVPPFPPEEISSSLVHKTDDFYTLNITWVLGPNGGSTTIKNHVFYIIENQHSDWIEDSVQGHQGWFGISNVTYDDVIYFKVSSENAIGIGSMTSSMKFIIAHSNNAFESGSVIQMYAAPLVAQKQNKKPSSLQRFLKPILISAVAFVTLLMVLLLVASYDREEHRMREPRCSRLICRCSCKQHKEYNPAPYGEPGLLWPWNIKQNRHSGAFDMKDELLPNDTIEMKYCNGTAFNYNALQQNGNASGGSLGRPKMQNTNKFNDFEPVVLFTPSKTPDNHSFAAGNPQPKLSNGNKRGAGSDVGVRVAPPRTQAINNTAERPISSRYASTPSIIEKYFQSQEQCGNTALKQNGYGNRFATGDDNVRNSILTEDSIDFTELDGGGVNSQITAPKDNIQQIEQLPVSPPEYNELYSDEPETGDPSKPSPPNYRDIISSLSDYSDAPRALFKKDGEPPRRGKRNRKSLDSLLLKTLEDIEEQQILTNHANVSNTPALERHVAIVRDALQKATRSFDSVSSTCSSSVGELRRAFEFGKKYGLQNYGEIPNYLQESMDDLTLDETNEEFDFAEHEKLLDLMALTNFSEQPRSSNDIAVKIPLPVRLTDSDEESDPDDLDEYEQDGLNGYVKKENPTLSLV